MEDTERDRLFGAAQLVLGEEQHMYEEPHEVVFAAICKLAALYKEQLPRMSTGELLQVLQENLDYDPFDPNHQTLDQLKAAGWIELNRDHVAGRDIVRLVPEDGSGGMQVRTLA